MGSTGEQLGVMKLSDALRKAQSLELDLVEVAANRKSSPAAKLKEIKFRVNIDEHDYLTKIRHGEEFLDRGNKVRVQLQFRGREMAHQEFGMQLMAKVKSDLAGMSQVEMEPKLAGRNITMTLSPLPANRRKRRFLPHPVAGEASRNGSDVPEK
ncbi:MAG: translation initiation factor IF-3 [Verrucomicrobia bacterium]|nr:MAG: translation initiation factor IF-3 [Verrucomicrobiota bacterium]